MYKACQLAPLWPHVPSTDKLAPLHHEKSTFTCGHIHSTGKPASLATQAAQISLCHAFSALLMPLPCAWEQGQAAEARGAMGGGSGSWAGGGWERRQSAF